MHELHVDKAVCAGALGVQADELHVIVPVTVANRTGTNLMVALLKRTIASTLLKLHVDLT